MYEPLISVIVPIYKVQEGYLKKGLDSIVNQTYRNLQIILVDDGSPDNSGSICDDYAKRDERIKVLHLENKGVSSARNAGIKVATGELLMFFDADDWMELNTLEVIIPIYLEHGCEMISWNHYYNYDGNIDVDVSRESMPNRINIYDKQMIEERLIYDMITPEYDVRYYKTNLGAVRAVWGKLYRTDIIKKNNITFDPNLKIGEDACFNIEYLKFVEKAVFVNEYLNHYRVGGVSANHGYRSDIVGVRLNLLKKYDKLFPNKSDEFYLCYTREVLSCIFNCLTKYYVNSLNEMKLHLRIKELKSLMYLPQIVCVFQNNICDYSFLNLKEKIMLVLIKYKMAWSLFFAGMFLL